MALPNHRVAALCGYMHLQCLKATEVIANAYHLPHYLFNNVEAFSVSAFMRDNDYLNPQYAVNM